MNVFNRIWFTLVGLCLVAAGALGFAASVGWLEADDVNDVIPFQDSWDEWRGITWSDGALWVLFAAACAAVLVALALALRQFRRGPDATRGDLVVQRTSRGRTTLKRSALESALEREAKGHAGVGDASVEALEVNGRRPTVRLRVDIDPGAIVPDVGRAVIGAASRSLGQMLAREPAAVSAEVRAHTPRGARDDNRKVE